MVCRAGLATGDWRLATGDWRPATGDWRLATGDENPREAPSTEMSLPRVLRFLAVACRRPPIQCVVSAPSSRTTFANGL